MADLVLSFELIQNPIFQFELGDHVPGPPGVGVPAGGNTGDVLQKVDGTDFNTQWAPPGAVDVEAYLNSLPAYNSNEDAITGGLAPGDWYKTGPGHLSAPAGLPIQVQ